MDAGSVQVQGGMKAGGSILLGTLRMVGTIAAREGTFALEMNHVFIHAQS